MRQRVVTALLLAIPALLALALRNPYPLAALGLVAAGVGGWEADRMSSRSFGCSFVATLLIIACARDVQSSPVDFGTVVVLAVGTAVGASAMIPNTPGLLNRLASAFAGLWIACPLLAILALHRTAPGAGVWCLSPALLALVPVWAGDIAAIFAGRALGKRLLAPKVSPKKTVEGSVANLLAAVLAAWLLGRLLHVSDTRSLGAGLAVGLLGQAGDLFESWLKRRAGVKDSGVLLPGHGGVLDRLDSVLFAAPAVALIVLS